MGKSTLFSTLTKKAVDCANFPFCTIEPNVGVVEVPDERLQKLADVVKTQKIIPAAIEFVDIAGLVKGAHKGEGLGNQFLANIREVDAICHVVRAFDDPSVTHVDGNIDAVRDAETIEVELAMADLQTVGKRSERLSGRIKSGMTKELEIEKALLERLTATLNAGKMASTLEYSDDEKPIMKEMSLLTNKPIIYVLNVNEEAAADQDWESPFSDGRIALPISVKVESEIMQLPEGERAEFMEALGLKKTGLDRLIRKGFEALDLITFFTAGEKEARAWPIPKGTTAPYAAGTIHTDFIKGFIRVEVIPADVYIDMGELGAREAGKQRIEGKDYVVQDGDVCNFRVGV